MRKLSSIFLFLSLGTIVHVQADPQKAFNCVDKQTLEISSQCMADKISQNTHYKNMQNQITNAAHTQSDGVMATLKYYPREGVIEVVAHRDALAVKNLTASVDH